MLWKYKAGAWGSTVWVQERAAGGNLYIRWRKPGDKKWTWECLRHRDRSAAIRAAKDLAHAIDTGRIADGAGSLTLASLFAAYEREESVGKAGRGAKEDRRRMDLWQAYLGDGFDPTSTTPAILKRFIRDRKANRVKVPTHDLSENPSDTTVGNDVRFLSCALTWAAREGYIERNPIRDFRAPRNINQKKPVATYDRFLAIRPHCEGLFGPFMDLVEATGWRVSALRQLRATDVDMRPRKDAPHGRLLKRAETDKVGVEAWVPMTADTRKAVEEVFRLNPVIGTAYLFPAVRANGKPWGLRYVWGLLRKAEDAAGLEHLDHGAFHPYRRKWRRERKHLPRADVAAAGGWLSVQTLDVYDGADPETVLAVVSETKKLRGEK